MRNRSTGVVLGLAYYVSLVKYFPKAALIPLALGTTGIGYAWDRSYGSMPNRIHRNAQDLLHNPNYWFGRQELRREAQELAVAAAASASDASSSSSSSTSTSTSS